MVGRAGRQAEVPEGYQPPAEKIAELRRRGMSDEEIASRTERFILDRRAKGILYARVDLGWWNWMTDRFVPTRGANARTGSLATARSTHTPGEATGSETSLLDRLLSARGDVRLILETNGNPDESAEAREAFNDRAVFIDEDRPGEDRWSKWKRLCAQEGVEL